MSKYVLGQQTADALKGLIRGANDGGIEGAGFMPGVFQPHTYFQQGTVGIIHAWSGSPIAELPSGHRTGKVCVYDPAIHTINVGTMVDCIIYDATGQIDETHELTRYIGVKVDTYEGLDVFAVTRPFYPDASYHDPHGFVTNTAQGFGGLKTFYDQLSVKEWYLADGEVRLADTCYQPLVGWGITLKQVSASTISAGLYANFSHVHGISMYVKDGGIADGAGCIYIDSNGYGYITRLKDDGSFSDSPIDFTINGPIRCRPSGGGGYASVGVSGTMVDGSLVSGGIITSIGSGPSVIDGGTW